MNEYGVEMMFYFIFDLFYTSIIEIIEQWKDTEFWGCLSHASTTTKLAQEHASFNTMVSNSFKGLKHNNM